MRSRPPLDEAAVLEAVDDPRDVGVVAAERAGEVAHGAGVLRVERAQGHDLRRREPYVGGDRGHAALAVAVEEPPHQAPGLVNGGSGLPGWRRRAHDGQVYFS